MQEKNYSDEFFEKEEPVISTTIDEQKETNEDHLYDEVQFPSLLVRIKALFVDFVFILILFSLASVIIRNTGAVPTWVRVMIFVFAFYLYDPLLITLFGGTIGHHMMKVGIRKVNHPDRKINLLQASIRFVIKYLLGWISFVTITGNKKRRAIHDIASGSIVLYK